jgi:polygalacturonase
MFVHLNLIYFIKILIMPKISFLLLVFIASFVTAQQNSMQDYCKKAPFTMPLVQAPSFSNKTYSIVDYGAAANPNFINTTAIQDAIVACNKSGGGIVFIPAGQWITGPIELLSNVNLCLDKKAILKFSTNHSIYPIIKAGKTSTTFTTASPIYAYDATNIAITGEGEIDGSGDSWRPIKKSKQTTSQWQQLQTSGVLSNDGKIWWPSQEAMMGEDYLKKLKATKQNLVAEDYLQARDFLRPYMVFFVNCSNILLQNVTLKNSPKFIFYPTKCSNIIVDGITIYNDWWAQNGDAIDISASKNVIIYNSTISCGDDAICMKSSNKSTNEIANLENIIIAKCTVYRSHGGFVIGSNTDGGMNNIFVTDCKFIGTDIGIRVKSNTGRGGLVHNVFIDNIEMHNIVNEAISFDTYYEDVVAGKIRSDAPAYLPDKVPEFCNFTIKNITCSKAQKAIYLNGLEAMPIHNISFENVAITATSGCSANYANDIVCKKVVINNNPKENFITTNCNRIVIEP